jgi:hypothetical protein
MSGVLVIFRYFQTIFLKASMFYIRLKIEETIESLRTFRGFYKGTGSRDFLVFFIKHLLVPIDMPRNSFDLVKYSWSYSFS